MVLFAVVKVLHAVPWWVGGVVVVIGAVSVQPRAVVVGLLLLLGARAGMALEDLAPATTRPLDRALVVLVSDPRANNGGWGAQGEIDGERVFLNVRVGVHPALGDAAVGDELVISGTLRGSVPESAWAISRRIVGNATVATVHEVRSADGVLGTANALRAAYADGVRHFDTGDRALFTGLVFGDDRNQDPIDADNFRSAGLGHLLAVSGQNVAFVLIIFAPALRRVRWVPARVACSLAVLVGFGFLTRFEASVTRALVMAGLALVAHAVGRRSEAAVILPPAVALLFVLDPLLGWSLAFQLSVAATVGMVVLAGRLARLMPGPDWLRSVVGATLGAQLFVAPLLLGTFGRLSVVAVPANVLAGPAAAGVMMWGLVVGPIAAIVPGPLAEVMHAPSWLLVRWVALVADTFASVGVGHFSAVHLTIGSIGLAAVLLGGERSGTLRSFPPALGTMLVVVAVGIPLLVPRPLPAGVHQLSTNVVVARSIEGFDVVVLGAGADLDDALEGIRAARLGRIDVLISESGSRRSGVMVHVLAERFEVAAIWAPPGHSVPGAEAREPLSGEIGSLQIRSVEGAVVIGER